jgi:hypothetical protein
MRMMMEEEGIGMIGKSQGNHVKIERGIVSTH